MTEHTPGPWDSDSRMIIASGWGAICEMSVAGATVHQKANARLIAAGPDLLEAADALVFACNRSEVGGPVIAASETLAKAIRKARGDE